MKVPAEKPLHFAIFIPSQSYSAEAEFCILDLCKHQRLATIMQSALMQTAFAGHAVVVRSASRPAHARSSTIVRAAAKAG